MKIYPRLPDAELDVMQVLWNSEKPLLRPEIEQVLAADHQWSVTTLLSLISRLEEKGFISRQKQGKGYLYSPAVAQKAYLHQESQRFLKRVFNGSARNLVAALNQNNALTSKEIDELRAYLDELKKE